MLVSFRNIFAGAAAAVLMTGAVAIAQSGAGHIINTPSINVGGPNGSGDSSGCCHAGPRNHVVNVPGVRTPSANIVVGGAHTSIGANTTTLGSLNALSSVSSGSGLIFFNDSSLPVGETFASTVLKDLNVDGAEEYVTKTVTKNVPVMEEFCLPGTGGSGGRPVQAVCIDDKGAPHPASQTFEDEIVPASQSGEIFRCMAGTYMQVTLGAFDEKGGVTFNHGQTLSCAKGEALIHKNGRVTCEKQAPRRNCNERSLLRRHGPGLKVLEAAAACVPSQRQVIKTVTNQVSVKKPSAAGGLVLNGGVGQGVY